tara:strand:+ start:328 stop:672 length:345 start_codon:yes stop_codon:yes gene_type:complete
MIHIIRNAEGYPANHYLVGNILEKGDIEVPQPPAIGFKWINDEWVAPSGLALKLLRQQRNVLLSATDWWASSDLTMTEEQTVYRQALRDLPSSASPSLDEYGQLTGVTWPTKPE